MAIFFRFGSADLNRKLWIYSAKLSKKGRFMVAALNILTTVWLVFVWYKSGFLAALNMFLFGVVTVFATMQLMAERGGL